MSKMLRSLSLGGHGADEDESNVSFESAIEAGDEAVMAMDESHTRAAAIAHVQMTRQLSLGLRGHSGGAMSASMAAAMASASGSGSGSDGGSAPASTPRDGGAAGSGGDDGPIVPPSPYFGSSRRLPGSAMSLLDDEADEEVVSFQRVVITGEAEVNAEAAKVCAMVKNALELRKKHVYVKPAQYWGGLRPDMFQGPDTPIVTAGGGDASPATGQVATGTGAGAGAGATNPAGSALAAAAMLSARRRLDMDTDSDSDADDEAKEAIATAMAGAPPRFKPFTSEVPGKVDFKVEQKDGVYHAYAVMEGKADDKPLRAIPSFSEFMKDVATIAQLVHYAPFKSFGYKRMQLLEARFHLHQMLNREKELTEQQNVPHRDFYNVRKVDTHVHHSACMNQKHLLRFIKRKLKRNPNELVIFRDGRFLTLAEVFKSLCLTAYDLSIDTLDMHADSNTFHRFDRFNLKYNPCGQSRLREIFLKTDNLLAGRYLAEITQQVFSDLETSKYQLAEYRVSVYGRKRTEWDKLARWVYVNRLASRNVRWLIQIPRLYAIYKKSGQVECFQDMLDNIFAPLFEVTLDPSSNPPLHYFLELVVGFDCVDDESKRDALVSGDAPAPSKWNGPVNPPFTYWVYYLSANLKALNALRESRGFSTFSFRPHGGEAGSMDHLCSTFLAAESVNHGVTMRKSPALQYLYYLAQVGLAVSPLSNNKLFIAYKSSPFYDYFARGMNVSLSTDDPLILHYTKEPLVEEYCVAAQVWKLSATDMCEIARNSVLQSGFEHPYKEHFLGANYHRPGPAGNDIELTNVPTIRLQFRQELLEAEHELITKLSKKG